MDDLDLLKREPTIQMWESTLRRLVRGELGYAVADLGSVDEVIRDVLNHSVDTAFAETLFQEALRNFIQSWQPSSFEPPLRSSRILDLIAAFTPRKGFSKGMEFIQLYGHHKEIRTSASVYATYQDLRLKALVALSKYYHTAPLAIDEDVAFRSYVNLLREFMLDERYSGYAARRLLELEVLQPKSVEIKRLVKSAPNCLDEIVTLILSPNRRSRFNDDITFIFEYCLDVGEDAVTRFKQALQRKNASIEIRPHGVEVRLDSGERVSLRLNERSQAIYLDLDRNAGSKKAVEKYKVMKASKVEQIF